MADPRPRPTVPLDSPPPSTNVTLTAANVLGAVAVYLYFTYLDLIRSIAPASTAFVVVVGAGMVLSYVVSNRHFGPVVAAYRRVYAGDDPATVPAALRRRALNAPLTSFALTFFTWTLAGAFFALRQRQLAPELPPTEAGRLFLGIVVVGGITTAVMAFLPQAGGSCSSRF